MWLIMPADEKEFPYAEFLTAPEHTSQKQRTWRLL